MKRKDREYLQQCYLRMLIEGDHSYTDEELKKWSASLDLPLQNQECFCIVVRSTRPEDPARWAKSLSVLKQHCEKLLADQGVWSQALVYGSMDVVLVLAEHSVFNHGRLVRLQKTLTQRMGSPVRLGVGKAYPQQSQLHFSQAEAYEALAWGGEQIAVADARDMGKTASVSSLTVQNSRRDIIRRFREGSLEGLDTELTKLAELIRSSTAIHKDAPYPSSIRRTMIELLVEMLHIASDAGVDVDEQIGYADPYRTIFDLVGTPAIVQWVFEIAQKLSGVMYSRKERMEDALLQEIKGYISAHLSDLELSLTSVSKVFGMSPSYLSAFFIREAGQGFKEYITAQRTELAKKHLLESRDSINVISEKCGFLSPSYFISVFKSQTGSTPGAFRKMKN